MKSKTNPNKVNQWTPPDPRQELFWSIYTNPEEPTFSDAKNSAIKAGYTEKSAVNITDNEWFRVLARRHSLLDKAEKVLEETITMNTYRPVVGMNGLVMKKTGKLDKNGKEIKEVVYDDNHHLMRIKQDSAKFVAERLGKKKGYTTRTELTGADGKDLPAPIYGGDSKK